MQRQDPPASGPAPTVSRSSFSPADAGLFVLLSSVWGMSFLFIKVAVETVSPLWVVAGRTSIGGLVLAVILRLRGAALPRERVTWLHLLVLATIGNAVPWGLIAWAQQTLPSGITAVLNSLVPASTLAVAVAVGVETLSSRRVAGLALAIAGTLAIMWGELQVPGRLLPLVVVAGATVMYGGASVYAKRFVSGRVRPLAVATGQILLSAALSLPLAWLVGPTPRWSELGPAVVVSLVLLGAFGTGLAFLLFYLLIQRVGPTNTTMVTYLIPVVAVITGWVLLGERLGLNVLVGAAGILGGVWLAQRQRTVTVDEELEELPR